MTKDFIFPEQRKLIITGGTELVLKDRVTGHNPVSVLYGQNFYYKRLQSQSIALDRKD